MTPLFLARRSAERFDSLVEGGRRGDVDRDTSDLLELVGALRSVPEAQARPAFVADLRERLMLAAATELTPTPRAARDDVARLTIKPSRTRRERRIGVALGAFAIVGASTSMAVASQGAIPGDALYPVKRAIENTQAGFSVGDDAKGETIIRNASRRLDEADELTQRGSSSDNAELVTKTLKDFTSQFNSGANSLIADYETNGHEASIQQVHTQSQDAITALAGLDNSIPTGGGAAGGAWSLAHAAIVNAALTVYQVDAQALTLCPACGAALTELPANLVSGAAPVVDGLDNLLAGGQLADTAPPTEAPAVQQQPQHQHQGSKGHGKPSTLNPPETPITVPTTPSDAASPGLGGILPGGNQGNGGNGSGGGKHKPNVVDNTVDTVNQVVTGVVTGVTGLLNGLTGNTTP